MADFAQRAEKIRAQREAHARIEGWLGPERETTAPDHLRPGLEILANWLKAASEQAEKARAEVEVRLGEAQADAAKLLAEARERAEVRERDIVNNAKQEADAMIEAARATITAEKEKALTAIRDEVVDLSLSAASKVVSRSVGSEDDRRLVEELVTAATTSGDGEA